MLYSLSFGFHDHNLTFFPRSVLLVSPPSMSQLGTLLSASQPGPQVSQQASPQPATRVVAHSAATGSLPQVRVVTTQPGLPTSSASQAATLVHQSPHHIRVPVTVAHGKNITQVHYSISSNNVCVFSLRQWVQHNPVKCMGHILVCLSLNRQW